MQYNLPKHLAEKSIALPEFSPKKRKKDWRGKPASWPDIRKNAQDGHIYLLVDTRYPIGFTATTTDGYSVKIDGVAYDNYENNAQFSIADWSEYSATDGYDINQPEGATKAHIIDIYPQSASDNITAFKCQRVAASGTEAQGLLWAHFNISNQIALTNFTSVEGTQYTNTLLEAITAKSNKLLVSSLYSAFASCYALEYLPLLDGNNSSLQAPAAFRSCRKLKSITLKNMTITSCYFAFYECYLLEEIKCSNALIQPTATTKDIPAVYSRCFALKATMPTTLHSAIQRMDNYITQAESLQDTVIDVSNITDLKTIGCYGSSSYFMGGLKGLRVSNEAPFDNATAPQINVSYTGMDRQALVQLFNDLPTVSAGQIINIVGCAGTVDLTADDETIATAKGWTITK